MTVIVALEADGRVHVGTDSYVGTEEDRDRGVDPKWFELGSGAVLAAYAGDLRAAQVTRHHAKVRAPTTREREDPERYLTRVVVPGVRRALDGEGALARSPSSGESMGAELVLAFAGRAWVVQADFSLVRSARGYIAAGAGCYAALGALAALRAAHPRMAPPQMVMAALRAAEECHPQVSGPFYACVR